MLRLALATVLLVACQEQDAHGASPPLAASPLVLVREDPSDAPIADLDDASLLRFTLGDARFELPFRESQGLGPLYIHRSCTSCHEDDARGPGAVRRLAFVGDGERGHALPYGDVVRPRLAAGARTPITLPERADVREEIRLGPAVFARGYLEALPDSALARWEEEQARRTDGISGRVHRLSLPDGSVVLGRFGLKARIATIEEFVADALLGDMGLTSPLRPVEHPNPDGLTDDVRPGVDLGDDEITLIADYVRLLAIPHREEPDARGRSLFVEARCDVCHVPRARTRSDHEEPVLRDREVELYTDLLLHDMGDALADGIEELDASGREWRTAPLIGLRHFRHFLHDGRATSVREAIEMHASPGSEANDAIERFRALSENDRALLVRFAEAL